MRPARSPFRFATCTVVAALASVAGTAHAAPPEPTVVETQFVAATTPAAIRTLACRLEAVWHDGSERPFDVVVDGRRCSSAAAESDAVTLTVRTTHREHSEIAVVLEAETPEGASTASLGRAVGDVRRELESRVERERGRDDGEKPSPVPATVDQWYGYQTLIADGAGLTMTISGVAANSGALAATGLTTAVLTPPILHFAHGNFGYGVASLGLRLGAPLGLGVLGTLAGWLAGGLNDKSAAVGLYGGCLLGWGVAAALDAAVFGHEKVNQPEESAALRRGGNWFTFRPDVALGHERGTVGVAGTF
jgi:hypothetical protein